MRIKVKGLVVREKPSGENAKLLTVLTDIGGVMTVNARGVRKISAAYLKSAQLFAFSDMLLYEKNGFRTLTEASLITDFYPLREDLGTFALASYVCEAASAFAVPGEESGGLLRLALNTLYALENKSYPVKQIKAAFELRLCAVSGFEPTLDSCPECGAGFDSSAPAFDFTAGELLCSDCSRGKAAAITRPVLMAMRHIVDSDDGRFMSFRIDGESLALLGDCAERYLLTHAERGFPTLDFYKKCEALE